ncbi:MAG TPA: putative LPS assembly protein LptD [Vicinamibacterales bacterium]|nr:putative LPS assembly protein LptD [Vicinamibacterales bacterium]
MNVHLPRLRRLLLAGACVLLAPVSIASAQDDAPLANCQIGYLKNNGPKLKDPDTGAWTVSVNVHLVCDRIEIFADELTIGDKTVIASGNVLISQEDTLPSGEQISVLRLNADRMEMDRQTRLATFYQAYGTARIANDPGSKSKFGSQEPDIMFHAEKIERLGPKTYKLTHGAFTTCLQPNPRWQMIGGSGTVELDHHASMTNVRFMVKNIPVLYVPYIYYPLEKDNRSTGLLIPSYSSSGIKGNGISNAYFVVLGKSQDMTLFHDYYTKAGQGGAAEYRFASAPGYGGNVRFHAFFEQEQLAADGTVARPAKTSYDFQGATSQPLGRGFTLIGNSYYFTDITFQQLYQQDVLYATNQRRNINVEVSGPLKLGRAASAPALQLRGLYQRNELFSGTLSSLQGSAPKVTARLTGNVGPTRIYYDTIAEGAYLQSRPFAPFDAPAAQTNVRRFDSLSTVRAPLSKLTYLSLTTSATFRLTQYLDSRDPVTGIVGPEPLTRPLWNLRAEMNGPRVQKVFLTPNSRFAQGFQHIIEPWVTVDWLSTFDKSNRIFNIDQVDTVATGTTRVSYSLTNTVMIKPNGPEGSVNKRQFLSVAVGQVYYSNAQAASVDPINPIAGAGTLSPVQVAVRIYPATGVYGQFSVFKNNLQWPERGRVQPSTQFSGSASVPLSNNRLVLSGGWSKTNYYTAAQGFVDVAPVHALNASAGLNLKDWGGHYDFYFDVVNQRLLQQRVTGYYHSQCCGIAVDYQTFSTVSSTVPVDHRLAITFTLAGIGSFSPPLGAFGR